MRIVGVRERVQIGLQHIVAAPVGEGAQIPLVMPFQHVANVRARGFGQAHDFIFIGRRQFAAQLFLQILVTQPLLPKRLRLVKICRKRRVPPIQLKPLVRVELEAVFL